MLDFFGDKDGVARSHQARTKGELGYILSLPDFVNPEGVHVSHPNCHTSLLPILFPILPFAL